MRLFLGITFAYAGLQKLTDPQFFQSSAPGYIGNQLTAFAHNSPLYGLIVNVAVPHAVLFGYTIAFGEIAIGLAVLCGLLFRPASFLGLLLSLVFFLTASWHVYPYFYGSDIVFAICWLVMLLNGPVATGYPALDTRLGAKLSPRQTPGLRSFIRTLLIGSLDRPHTAMPPGQSYAARDLRTSSWQGNAQQYMSATVQSKQEARRNFLLGTIAGMSTLAGLGLVGSTLNTLFSKAQNTTTQTNTPPTDTTQNGNPSHGASTGSGGVIAQVSAVARNTSTPFTIRSTGDPGLLIHLPNDQFVAYDATCTHLGCPVTYDPTSHHLVCPCHGATYDPAQQAAVLAGPTTIPLTALAIHIDSATGAITLV
jgi:thiosulfate dehydrogenase [quinone] large subunit